MKFIRILLVILAVSAIAACGAVYWLYNTLNTPHEHAKANDFIVIPKGSMKLRGCLKALI